MRRRRLTGSKPGEKPEAASSVRSPGNIQVETIYLNHAATSWPKPPEVIRRVRATLEAPPVEAGRGGGRGADPLQSCRESLATLFGMRDPRRVVLTSGATQALNLAIVGAVGTLAPPGGARAGATGARADAAGTLAGGGGGSSAVANTRSGAPVRCTTSVLEHNSVLRPLRHLAHDGRAVLDFLSLDEFRDPTAVGRRLRDGTRVVVLTAASNVTGARPDLRGVAALCERAGAILVIDAAQAAGAIPLDVPSLGPRVLVAVAGHKGLLGPPGTGALLVGEGFGDDELPPLLVGGTGVRSDSPLQPREWPLHLEAGTMNLPGFAGLAAGVDLVLTEGVERIGARRARLTSLLLDGLDEISGVQFHRPLPEELAAGVAAFNLAGWDPGEVALVLEESWGIVTRGGLHCAPLALPALGWPHGSLRASVGRSSTEADVHALVAAVRTLAASSAAAA